VVVADAGASAGALQLHAPARDPLIGRCCVPGHEGSSSEAKLSCGTARDYVVNSGDLQQFSRLCRCMPTRPTPRCCRQSAAWRTHRQASQAATTS